MRQDQSFPARVELLLCDKPVRLWRLISENETKCSNFEQNVSTKSQKSKSWRSTDCTTGASNSEKKSGAVVGILTALLWYFHCETSFLKIGLQEERGEQSKLTFSEKVFHTLEGVSHGRKSKCAGK